MTAQIPETLVYEGRELSMCAEPLGNYFALAGLDPPFEWTSTALWRGYVGTWEIVDGRLYLTEINGTLKTAEVANLASLFPDFPERVFAHWYSGTTRSPEGKLLEYFHMGYASIHERDRYFEFEKGVVLRTWAHENGTSGEATEADGYAVRAATIFDRQADDGDDLS